MRHIQSDSINLKNNKESDDHYSSTIGATIVEVDDLDLPVIYNSINVKNRQILYLDIHITSTP